MMILSSLLSGATSPLAIGDVQWPALTDLARQQNAGPLLLWRLAQAGADTTDTRSWIAPLRADSRTVAVEHIRYDIAQAEVNAAFRAVNIPAIWLKGFALSRTVYPDPALRPMGDLDVLIPFHERQRALQIAHQLGYSERPEQGLIGRSDDLSAQMAHHDHLWSAQHRVTLEVHFQFARTLLPREQMQWFYSQTVQMASDESITILNPAAHLLYLCAHTALQHGEVDFRLLRYFDVHLLVLNSALNWDEVIRQAKALGWSYAVERTLSLAMQFFSTPVPPSVPARLSRDTGRVRTYVHDVQGSGARWGKMRKQLSLLPLPARIRLIRAVVFPPRAYMHQRYREKRLPFVGLMYVYRWLDQGREVWFWARGRLSRGKGGHEHRI